MRVNAEGQLVLPAETLRRLDLKPGDEVGVRDAPGGEVVVFKPKPQLPQQEAWTDEKQAEFEAILDRLAGKGSAFPWSTDEWMDTTRGSERRDPNEPGFS